MTIPGGLEDNTNHERVKTGILAAYSIITEGYRQTLRNLNKAPHQTYLEFVSEKLRALKKWFNSAAVTTFDQLVNLMVLEEFKRNVPHLMLRITSRDGTDLLTAAEIAD